MRERRRGFGGLCLLLLCWVAVGSHAQQSASTSLSITAPPSSSAVAGKHFELQLTVTGGAAPYHWRVTDGTLPPGLKLHAHSGVLSGAPTTPGEYHLSLGVADSNGPPLTAKRELVITVVGAVAIDWKQYPKVQGNAINGSVVVSNQSGGDLDLTVIIVAVNSIGRATALGYQHFILPAQKTDQVIPFGGTPGPQSYIVHADAVAHHPEKSRIFRARKETPAPLQITDQ